MLAIVTENLLSISAGTISEHVLTYLAIKDISSGVEDGGVVHNLNVSWNQFLGKVEFWALSQLGYSPAV